MLQRWNQSLMATLCNTEKRVNTVPLKYSGDS